MIDRNTPKGRAKVMFDHIVERAENKRGNKPSYSSIKLLFTRQEFYAWAIPRLEEWITHHPLSESSIDRLDNSKHYEFSNLQITTKTINNKRHGKHLNAPDAHAWCSGHKDYTPVNLFYKSSKNKSTGVQGLCKLCSSEEQRRSRTKNR